MRARGPAPGPRPGQERGETAWLLLPDSEGVMVGELDQEKLVPVFEAGSEFEALSVQAFLEEEGLEAAIMDLQIPMLDGIAMVRDPRWGLVMVLERDESRARELVAAYLESMAAVARLAETGRDPDAGFDGGEEGCYDEEEREYD